MLSCVQCRPPFYLDSLPDTGQNIQISDEFLPASWSRYKTVDSPLIFPSISVFHPFGRTIVYLRREHTRMCKYVKGALSVKEPNKHRGFQSPLTLHSPLPINLHCRVFCHPSPCPLPRCVAYIAHVCKQHNSDGLVPSVEREREREATQNAYESQVETVVLVRTVLPPMFFPLTGVGPRHN